MPPDHHNRAETMSSKRIAERVEIHLKYEGPDVDSGTMAEGLVCGSVGVSSSWTRSTQVVPYRMGCAANPVRSPSSRVFLRHLFVAY